MATSTGADLFNLLLGLAWLGELDRRQIQRLWFADKSESTVEKTLTRLHKQGLLARRTWSIRDEQRGVTVPQLARWSLAPAGHKEVKASDQYPAKPAQVRQQRLIPHDARTTEAIVRLIEVGRRSRLSGIYVARELRLNPQESRPVCDALVVVQFGSFDRPNLVPWSSDPAIEDEGRLRFAVEADNDTEPLGVIAGKAHAYRKLAEDDTWAAWWTQQHGPLPIPLWVAPTEERALAIHRQWKRAWPKGKWLVTSDVGLRQNELLQWSQQEEERVVLRFSKGRIALPATEPPPPIPPTQGGAPAPLAQLPPKQELIAASAAPPALPVAAPPAALAVPTPAHPPVAAPSTAEPPPATPGTQTLLPAPTKEEYTTRRGRLQAVRRWLALSWRLLRWLAWTTVAFLDEFGGLLGGIIGLLWRGACAAVRSCRDTDPLEALRGAAITATVVLAISFAGVALSNPSLVSNALPSPRSAAEPTLEAAAPPPPVETAMPPPCPTARVTASGVNLRPSAGKGERPLRKLRLDERLSVLDCQGEPSDGFLWWEVEGEDGMRGWAATEWLEEVH